MNCRFCNNKLSSVFIDMGNCPLSNSFLTKKQLDEPEMYFPLKLFVCNKCFLVQVDEFVKSTEIFNNNYAYYSSYSTSWLTHCQNYVSMIQQRLNLNSQSQVIEIASNDGYLLQFFKKANIPCLGIEPAEKTAEIAIKIGIETIIDFFNEKTAEKLAAAGKKADLIIGNNVLAHVPDLKGFVRGLKIILKENGIITLEFPHILQLIKNNQFDTIYHEHFSYFSLHTIVNIFNQYDLQIIDAEEILTHGGSLRVYASHITSENTVNINNLQKILLAESEMNLHNESGYYGFPLKVNKIKLDLLKFLVKQKNNKKIIAAYGAAAKGNTLLNYCGIKKDMIDFVVDASPYKQNKFMPGSHIPILSENMIKEKKPDYILILPWNIKEEIIEQLNYLRDWGGKFVIAIPELNFL